MTIGLNNAIKITKPPIDPMQNTSSSMTYPKSSIRLRKTLRNSNRKTHQTEQTETIQQLTKQHNKTLKQQISNQIRVYNITHTRLPRRYEVPFNQTLQQYIENYGNTKTEDTGTLTAELQTLYAYVKQQIIQADNPKRAAVHTQLAHTILKIIDQRTQR